MTEMEFRHLRSAGTLVFLVRVALDAEAITVEEAAQMIGVRVTAMRRLLVAWRKRARLAKPTACAAMQHRSGITHANVSWEEFKRFAPPPQRAGDR